MFIPIRTDRQLRKTPWANYSLIAINLVIFLLTRQQVRDLDHVFANIQVDGLGISFSQLRHEFPVFGYYLLPQHLKLFQFISYQFLHSDVWHLAGNMLFLFIFGNSVEDRFGKVAYLAFYLTGGIIAGIGHSMLSTSPVLGASGAVAAVTGAFLALFPKCRITIIFWFIVIFPYEISSLLLIGFQIAKDIFMELSGGGNVAYGAHLAGYLFGFAVGMLLLWWRILPRETFDMLALWEQRKRRRKFKKLASQGYSPWRGGATSDSKQLTPDLPVSPQEKEIMLLRAMIYDSLSQNHPEQAAKQYTKLLELSPDMVMSVNQQLDIANQLMAQTNYDHAAQAYELYLKNYKTHMQVGQIQLILGLIYTRYIDQKTRAQELLTKSLVLLDSEDDKQLAQTLISELNDEI